MMLLYLVLRIAPKAGTPERHFNYKVDLALTYRKGQLTIIERQACSLLFPTLHSFRSLLRFPFYDEGLLFGRGLLSNWIERRKGQDVASYSFVGAGVGSLCYGCCAGSDDD